jgi:hypothetical protein
MPMLYLGNVTGGDNFTWDLLFALDRSGWTKSVRFDASRIRMLLVSVESPGICRASAASESLELGVTAPDELFAFNVTEDISWYPEAFLKGYPVPAITPLATQTRSPLETPTVRFTSSLGYWTRRRLIVQIHVFLFFGLMPPD